jgi:hypothetical protein
VVKLKSVADKGSTLELSGNLVRRYCIVASKFSFLKSVRELDNFELDNDNSWGDGTGLVIEDAGYGREIDLGSYLDFMFFGCSVKSYCCDYSYRYGTTINELDNVLFILRDDFELTPFFKRVVDDVLDLDDFCNSFKIFLSGFRDDSVLGVIGDFVNDEDDLNVLLTTLKLVEK